MKSWKKSTLNRLIAWNKMNNIQALHGAFILYQMLLLGPHMKHDTSWQENTLFVPFILMHFYSTEHLEAELAALCRGLCAEFTQAIYLHNVCWISQGKNT